MQTKDPAFFARTLLCIAILSLFCVRGEPQTAIPSARITQAVDEKNLVVLKGNVHPLALAEFDQGAVSDGEPSAPNAASFAAPPGSRGRAAKTSR